MNLKECIVVVIGIIAIAAIAIFGASKARGDDSPYEIKAKAAIAMQIAIHKAKTLPPKDVKPMPAPIPGEEPADKPLTLAEAKELTRKSHCIVVVSVNIDCKTLCAKIRPDMAVCHTDELWSDKTPRVTIILADGKGAIWQLGKAWSALPTEEQIRREAANLPTQVKEISGCSCVNCPGADCQCGCQARRVLPAQLIPQRTPGFSNFCPTCPNGRCGR